MQLAQGCSTLAVEGKWGTLSPATINRIAEARFSMLHLAGKNVQWRLEHSGGKIGF